MNLDQLKDEFSSIFEVISYFKDPETCRDYIEKWRWKDGIYCPHCYHDKAWKYSDGKRFKCGECRKYFSVLKGTIFESTQAPLPKWMLAIYLITSHKKGISSYQLGRDIGVKQATAWFMAHRIRNAMQQDNDQLEGTIQVDETFVGGKNKNRHKDKKVPHAFGRSYADKTPIMGMVDANGKVKTVVIPNTSGTVMLPILKQNIKEGSVVCSDEWNGYKGVKKHFDHRVIYHNLGKFSTAEGDTTNRIEGFWASIKRAYVGIFHYISPKHLFRYANEVTLRYNTIPYNTSQRMNFVMTNVNARLSYKDLINKKHPWVK